MVFSLVACVSINLIRFFSFLGYKYLLLYFFFRVSFLMRSILKILHWCAKRTRRSNVNREEKRRINWKAVIIACECHMMRFNCIYWLLGWSICDTQVQISHEHFQRSVEASGFCFEHRRNKRLLSILLNYRDTTDTVLVKPSNLLLCH